MRSSNPPPRVPRITRGLGGLPDRLHRLICILVAAAEPQKRIPGHPERELALTHESAADPDLLEVLLRGGAVRAHNGLDARIEHSRALDDLSALIGIRRCDHKKPRPLYIGQLENPLSGSVPIDT